MIYSLFYRHNSSCTVFWVSSFHLSVNIVVLYQFKVPGHVKLKREASRTEKRFKIAIICFWVVDIVLEKKVLNRFVKADVVKYVFVYMYLRRDFLTLKPFHNYSLCSVCILPQPAFYSQSAVCSPQSAFYTDRKI